MCAAVEKVYSSVEKLRAAVAKCGCCGDEVGVAVARSEL
jgi:hypothetical protein